MGYNAEKKVEKEFALVNNIIERHWNRAIGLANAESLMTYWTVGAFVSARLRQAQWGAKTVEALCDYLKTHNPKRRGFGKRQIYNMVQFYDTYTLPEYQVISERLRLHEQQLPRGGVRDAGDERLPFRLRLPRAAEGGAERVHGAEARVVGRPLVFASWIAEPGNELHVGGERVGDGLLLRWPCD